MPKYWSSDVCSSDLGTINGYGERTGNCNLTSVIPNVALKLGKRCVPENSLAKLRELSLFVDDIEIGRASCRERVDNHGRAGSGKESNHQEACLRDVL